MMALLFFHQYIIAYISLYSYKNPLMVVGKEISTLPVSKLNQSRLSRLFCTCNQIVLGKTEWGLV